MQLVICAIGKVKKSYISDWLEQYIKRLQGSMRSLGIANFVLYEIAASKADEAVLRMRQEGKKILEQVGEQDILVLCDERGKNLTSPQIAEKLQNYIDNNSKNIIFAIGGADGFCESVKHRADLKISFGQQVWPHQMVRLMLLEQLYRASTILLGHPYHRE